MRLHRASPRQRVVLLGGGLGIALLAIGSATAAVSGSHHRDTISTAPTSTVRPTATASASAASVHSGEVPQIGEVSDFSTESAAVQAELNYVLAYWNSPNESQYGFIEEFDCMNFTSQALVARGWSQDSTWWSAADGDVLNSSTAWRSSTAFMAYLSEHPQLATALTDTQRAQVRVGDIVQFDWDTSGDRDHTGIVTRIDTDASGQITIYYAGHTDNTLLRSVDWAINVLHPGGTASYWHLS